MIWSVGSGWSSTPSAPLTLNLNATHPSSYTNLKAMSKSKTKLHQLLHEREMSTKDLERALIEVGEKIEYYQLTEFRKGKRTNYTTETLYKLCKALDCTPNDIVDWTEKPQPKKRKSTTRKTVESMKVGDNTSEYANDNELDAYEETEIDYDLEDVVTQETPDVTVEDDFVNEEVIDEEEDDADEHIEEADWGF